MIFMTPIGTEVVKVKIFKCCGTIKQFVFEDESGRTFCGNAETKVEALKFSTEVSPLPKGDTATAVMIGDRYFKEIKNNRVITAWHIAASALYRGDGNDHFLDGVLADLTARKKKFKLIRVGVVA